MMKKLSLLTVLLAVSLRITLAQNGYNYDRPEVNLAGGARPPAGGFPGAQADYPSAVTTPTYAAPSFPPNQGAAGGGGYNYPPAQSDFPSGPSTGTTGYPSGPQRPSTGSAYAPPQGGGANAPYPAGPQGGSSPYPGQGQPQRPTGIGGGSQSFSPIAPSSPGGGFGPGGNLGGGSGSGSSSGSSSSSQQDESQEGDYSAIPGEPDIDYPIYSEIPETSFDCNQQEFPGYYADVEARCQVFHICALNKTFNFLCPNGTIFSQEHLVCVWWNQFDCNSAPGLFANNANLYDNSQTGQQGGAGPNQGGVASDFPSAGGSTGPYPPSGRPQTPSFGSTGSSGPYPPSSTNYQPSAPTGGPGNYPAPTGGASSYQPPSGPQQGFSTQGPYPSGPANVPSPSYQQPPQQGYQPPQSDSGYPAAGVPQTTPSRDYLPPRRG